MALADKDRIFTNLYGFQPWNLSAARMRGDWDNTKDLIARGRDAIIQEMKDSGFAAVAVRASPPA
jgi:NADH-quinone oxidoreductase subunit F